MLKNEAKYHNECRGHFRSYNLQREVEKRSREEDSNDVAFSPKKTRASFSASLDRKTFMCVCCEMFEKIPMKKCLKMNQSTKQVVKTSRNLCKWTVESNNWVVHARLNTPIIDIVS